MSDVVLLHRDGDVGIITLNNPPVNALSPAVMAGLAASLDELLNDSSIRAIVLAGAGKAFCGGADIKEFAKLLSSSQSAGDVFNPLLNHMEQSPKPIVAAIQGTCFGGGLETAMACHYRIASADAQLGQPEVKLGLIPGAGGTQRLPRLIGINAAIDMCVNGNPINAAQAQSAGLVDQVVTSDLLANAVRMAREAKGPRPTCDRIERLEETLLVATREQLLKKSRHNLAALRAIEAVEAAGKLPFVNGLKFEAKLFRECLMSPQSRSLIHVFFSERECGKIPGLVRDVAPIPIRKAAVVGAGTMGGGIAMVYANAGIPVLLKEVSQDVLDRGLATIRKNYAGTVQKGRLTQAEMDQRLALIQPTLSFDGFSEADIVIEAVFEDMDIKKKVFAELDKVARPDAIMATNTSTLDVDAIASATTRPQQVIGHHFFSPANVMKLLEVVRGRQSCPAVIATSMALAKSLGKTAVCVGNCWGFVGNRLFFPYLREAQFLVEEGAAVDAVDAALTNFGMAMGPFAVDDLAGIDVGWRVRQAYPQLSPAGQRAPLVADKLYEMGRYGQKTGSGWYRYEGRTPVVDADITRLIDDTARSAGVTKRSVTTEEMIERPLYAIINEGAKALEEGIALRASDIDVIYIYGYGFPPFRGGPMWYADAVGVAKVYERILQFEREVGPMWKPAPLLKKLAETGGTFAQLDAKK